jgi:putative CocE/NonD family hydrolase
MLPTPIGAYGGRMGARGQVYAAVIVLVAATARGAAPGAPPDPQYPGLPSETPAEFVRPAAVDYEYREVMVPMRDGVRLRTCLLVPKGAHGAGMLLTRTPYDARKMTSLHPSQHLASRLWGYDHPVETIVEGGYIRVVQDVRGKFGSEGDFVMNRPMRGPLNPTPVDESTDAYDTIEWLVHHVPESNGRVAVIGISYDGFTALAPLVHPHPALKAVVPANPMVDGWRGDDWFHHGAFRLQYALPYAYEQAATRGGEELWESDAYDDYDAYLRPGSAGEVARRHGLEQVGFWRKIVEHPAYDAFWREQAMDRVLAREPLQVPTLLVAGLWDQEDIYGAIAVWKALDAVPANRDRLFLAIGPWFHGQQIEEASALGPIRFDADTGLYFRRKILAPFLARYLKQDGGPPPLARVTAFRTGENAWHALAAWPAAPDGAAGPRPSPLYLHERGQASFAAPGGEQEFDEYVSDPGHPVPYRTRPILPVGYEPPFTWTRWLVDDQREFSGRTDVVTYATAPLTAPVAVSGEPVANLVASTTGTDADWVVKLIDVYPDEVAGQRELGGYQLAVAMDIFRARYREDEGAPKPVAPNVPLTYRFPLPTVNHVFLPGHRIMVQVQSAWFPLYDRNPQTFVPNVFLARPEDYRKATQRVWHAPGRASFVELPRVDPGTP